MGTSLGVSADLPRSRRHARHETSKCMFPESGHRLLLNRVSFACSIYGVEYKRRRER